MLLLLLRRELLVAEELLLLVDLRLEQIELLRLRGAFPSKRSERPQTRTRNHPRHREMDTQRDAAIAPQSAIQPGAAWAQSGEYFEAHCCAICEKFFPK